MPDVGQRRVVTLIVATLLAVGLAIAALVLPVPYVELSPGKTCDALTRCSDDPANSRILDIKGAKTYDTAGQLRLTTVSVLGGPGSHMTLYDAIRGWLDGDVAVLPRDITFPPDQSADEEKCQNKVDQESSQQLATTAALRQLGYTVPVTKQVYASAVTPSGAAAMAKLTVCDVIETVDGKRPTDGDDLIKLLQVHKPGDVVDIGFVRRDSNDQKQPGHVSVKLGADPKHPSRPLLGVDLAETEISHPPFTVTLDLRGVGGPSAGLMFALAIIDELTPGALPGGKIIAGTGTINSKGTVGPIGGVQQKVLAAKRDGATVFLTPKRDCADAVGAHIKGVRLVSMDTLADALSALAALRGERGTIKQCHG